MARDAVGLAVGDGDLVQALALAAAQQPVENLAEDQRRQHRDVARAVQQMDQAQHRIQQAGVDTVDVEATVAAPAGHFHGPGVGDQLGDFRRVDIQPDAEVGRVRRGVDHLAGQRQGDRDHQVVQRIVDIAFLGQLHLLAALGDDAQGRFVHAARRQGGAVGANQGEGVDGGAVDTVAGTVLEQQLRQFALALAQFGGEIDGKKRGVFAHAGTRGGNLPKTSARRGGRHSSRCALAGSGKHSPGTGKPARRTGRKRMRKNRSAAVSGKNPTVSVYRFPAPSP